MYDAHVTRSCLYSHCYNCSYYHHHRYCYLVIIIINIIVIIIIIIISLSIDTLCNKDNFSDVVKQSIFTQV